MKRLALILCVLLSSCSPPKKEETPPPPPAEDEHRDPPMTSDQIITEVKKCRDAGLEAQSYGYPDDKGVISMTTDIQCKVDSVGGSSE